MEWISPAAAAAVKAGMLKEKQSTCSLDMFEYNFFESSILVIRGFFDVSYSFTNK